MTTTSARVLTRATLPQVGGRLDSQARPARLFLAQRVEQRADLLERDRGRRRCVLGHRRRRLGPPAQHAFDCRGVRAATLVALLDELRETTATPGGRTATGRSQWRPRPRPARRAAP